MDIQLQDRRAVLWAQVMEVDERIALDKCRGLTDQAEAALHECKRLLVEAAEKDRASKKAELEKRRQSLEASRAELIGKVEQCEVGYRSAVRAALSGAVEDGYKPTPAETTILHNDNARLVSLGPRFYRALSWSNSQRVATARHALSAARRELAALVE